MLAYVLAIVVGLGSVALYMAAFFFPEVHRKNDFIWSGIGLFYALVLWVCAGRITGGVLLGQMAGVALLGWLSWQTFLLRRQLASPDQQTPLPTGGDLKAAFSNLSSSEGRSQLAGQAANLFTQVRQGMQGAIATATQAKSKPEVVSDDPYIPPRLDEFGTAGKEAAERFARVEIADPAPLQEAVDETISEVTDLEVTDQAAAIADQVSDAIASVSEDAFVQVQSEANQMAEDREDASKVATSEAAISEAATAAAETVQDAIANPSSKSSNGLAELPQRITNPIKVLIKTVQSLFKGAAKKESKPIYVRKQFRAQQEAAPEATEPPTDLVTVVEEFTVTETAEGELMVESVAEIVSDAEIVSEAIMPDLLGTAPSEVTAEEIVEELLEDISAQEGTSPTNIGPADIVIEATEIFSEEAPAAVPPHPPSPDLVEAAIADAEEKGIPYAPPTPEGETDPEEL